MSVKPTEIVRKLKPYIPGEQPRGGKFIKLNTNENPYPAAPDVLIALHQAPFSQLRLYPDPLCMDLRRLLAVKHNAKVSEIFIGNGSDEVLRLLFQAYLEPSETLAMVNPTYSLYPVIAAQIGAKVEVFELGKNGELPPFPDLSAFKVFVIANPNPPYGTFYQPEILERLIASAPGTLFIIDEAYVDFADGDCLALARQYPNAAITRTFSKSSSLAGARLGYALGGEDIINNLYKLKDSYNVDYMTQVMGCAAIRAHSYYKETANHIKDDRAFLTEELRALGFKVYDSQGNFIFAENGDGKSLYEKLKKKKILVRFWDAPRLNVGVRITIGTHEELLALINAIKE
ncbi:MAG TPA: histidinol-phosphate transaminase [Candidatus Sumerlaeota bacterium]|nr:MAG: Histidinol-phosphate aminotransferase [candidate division BRC1 bacterium ADurb.Bin183]HOE62736.1 histidinol-phosphate transaminase [Candidatus Sumerlaeota bacterium]HRR29736.1 histidinol-phosphate transaminase [Candidatus Sumerlaeia bacterium]HON50404.1 histidinol-phosphate transaminase [Candidatus Sumerlaeota bacterium]HOR63620.1 histidinol-phosphate transaminase [Candidatus Sumerlaeota bacterium]